MDNDEKGDFIINIMKENDQLIIIKEEITENVSDKIKKIKERKDKQYFDLNQIEPIPLNFEMLDNSNSTNILYLYYYDDAVQRRSIIVPTWFIISFYCVYTFLFFVVITSFCK